MQHDSLLSCAGPHPLHHLAIQRENKALLISLLSPCKRYIIGNTRRRTMLCDKTYRHVCHHRRLVPTHCAIWPISARIKPYLSVCDTIKPYLSVCDRIKPYLSVCDRIKPYLSVCDRIKPYLSVCDRIKPYLSVSFHLAVVHHWKTCTRIGLKVRGITLFTK